MISGENPRGGAWTGAYKKACAEDLGELEQWAENHVGKPIRRCRICQPLQDAAQPSSTKRVEPSVVPKVPDGHSEIHGPVRGSAAVEAWADEYIRFERRPVWQEQLRTAIQTRCRRLEPTPGEVLHAIFFGPKRRNADVENLVLYNIGWFAIAGSNGIRFEHGAGMPPAPSGREYRYCYRYALVPRSDGFAHWQPERTLATFDWTDLGAFAGEKKLSQAWLALARQRDHITITEPALGPRTPFALRVQVRPPRGCQPVWGNLVKGIFDGVICAFQAHTDTAVLPDVVARLAAVLPADHEEIEGHLLEQRQAVLGVVPRLVYRYGKGVKWDPADHLCVAGELLAAEPVDTRWAVRGEIVELSR